jgi:hypothetical protein
VQKEGKRYGLSPKMPSLLFKLNIPLIGAPAIWVGGEGKNQPDDDEKDFNGNNSVSRETHISTAKA